MTGNIDTNIKESEEDNNNKNVELLQQDLHDLFIGKIFNKQQEISDKLTILVRSEIDRCKITIKKPVKLSELENILTKRYGVKLNIYHSNQSYDFLQKINNQNELNNLIRLHEMRNGEKKFRITVSPKKDTDDIDNSFRGFFDVNAFMNDLENTKINDLQSDTSTSGKTFIPSGRFNLKLLPDIPERKPPEKIHIGKIIGTGAHGTVHTCYEDVTGEMLVVKKVHAKGDANTVKRKMDSLIDEVVLLSRLSHENIVQYRGAVIAKDFVLIFMEYMTGGSVYDMISESGPLSITQVTDATKQILSGLEYLHNLGIVHRDIKTSNIMRTSHIPVIYKIGDFGSAQFLRALASFSPEYKGTPQYTAPEIFRKNYPYNEKADIWSVGITIIEMLTSKTPYSEYEPTVLCVIIAESENIEYELPKNTPKNLSDLVAKILVKEPRKRPKATEILNSDILKQ